MGKEEEIKEFLEVNSSVIELALNSLPVSCSNQIDVLSGIINHIHKIVDDKPE